MRRADVEVAKSDAMVNSPEARSFGVAEIEDRDSAPNARLYVRMYIQVVLRVIICVVNST